MFDSALFYDAFLESPFGIIFGLGNIFYFGNLFEFEELFHKHNGFINDHEYQEVQSISHVSTITESGTCFSITQLLEI